MKLSDNAEKWAESSYAECLVESSETIEKELPTIAFKDQELGVITSIINYLEKKSYEIVLKRVDIYIEAFKKDRQLIDDNDEKEIIEDLKRVIEAMYIGDTSTRRLGRFLLDRDEEYKKNLLDVIKRKYHNFLGKAALRLAKAKAEMFLTMKHQESAENKETLNSELGILLPRQRIGNQPNKIQILRDNLTNFQQETVNRILDFYLDNQKWIPELTLCLDFQLNTKEINERLKLLGGMIIWINLNDPNQIRYVLGFPGILLSKIGNQIEKLFIRYLEFLRNTLILNNEKKSIKLADVVESLKFGDYEKQVFRLCFELPWNPFGGLEGSMADPNILVPRSHINLVLAQNIHKYFYLELEGFLDLEVPLESNKHYFYTRRTFSENKQLKAVTKLKEHKKTMVRTKAAEVKGSIDFGIITIRDDEHRAVLARFPKAGIIDGNRQYMLSEINIDDCEDKYKIAVLRLPEMGETEALNATRDMIEDLDPSWIVLVGIAGGVPSSDFTLGDVLIATRLVDFCIEEVSLSGVRYDTYGGEMHPEIRRYVPNLAAREDEISGWNSHQQINCSQPSIDISDGKYYEEQGSDENWKAKVKKTLIEHFGNPPLERAPKFMIASNASSDRLVKDPKILKVWQTTGRKIQSVEMELAGVYKAARRVNKEYPVLAIRGISDIVGFERDDAWTKYACNTAASLAYFLLKFTRPIEPRQNQIDLNVVNETTQNAQILSSNKTAKLSLEERQDLINRLAKLYEPLFETFLTALNPTYGVISSSTAPQARRASDLINWAESEAGIGVVELNEQLNKFIKSSRRS